MIEELRRRHQKMKIIKYLKNIFSSKSCKHERYHQYKFVESDGTLMHYFKCYDCDFHDFGCVIGSPDGWAGETRKF